jgi:hypothetical protein
MQVSPIEDAAIDRVKISEEQAEANDPVCYVGHGNDEFAGIFQRGDGPPQYRRGIAQMLQDIREQDVIEDSAVRESKGFHVGAMKDVIVRAGSFRGRRIAFYSRDRVALLLQDLSQIALRTADVENAERVMFFFEFFQDAIVATVLEILKDIAAVRIWALRSGALRMWARSQYTLL